MENPPPQPKARGDGHSWRGAAPVTPGWRQKRQPLRLLLGHHQNAGLNQDKRLRAYALAARFWPTLVEMVYARIPELYRGKIGIEIHARPQGRGVDFLFNRTIKAGKPYFKTFLQVFYVFFK